MTALLCLAVIYIHVAGEAVFSYDKTSLAYAVTYITFMAALFVVPAFIFLGAVKFSLSLSNKHFSYGRFMLGRMKLIFLPYVLWNIAYYLYFVARWWFPFNMSGLVRHILIGDLSGQFYFIVIIMQFYLLAPVWRRFANLSMGLGFGIAGCTFALIYLPVYLPGTLYADRWFLTYLPYWLAGVTVGANYERCVSFLHRIKPGLLISAVLWGVTHLLLNYQKSLDLITYGLAETVQGLNNILAISSILIICTIIDTPRVYAVCKKLSDASYYIFLSHCLVLTDARIRMSDAGMHAVTTRFIIAAAATYTIPIILSIAYIKIKPMILEPLKNQ
jgi:hypothetical protein